jgi:predicted GIY-YIG superfamily endonuclease
MNTISFPQKTYTTNFPEKWLKKDEGCSKFYVYILKRENKNLYIGYTRELKERFLEHKEGVTPSTAGEHPKLRYFEILPTREAAKNRETELQHLLRYNRRELFRIMTEFQSLVSQVDLN